VTTVFKTMTAAATAKSVTVSGLANGTAYTFDVTAINAVGTGSVSARSASVTPRTVPAAPRIVIARSGRTGGKITATVVWIVPATIGGSAVTGYIVTARHVSSTGAVLRRTVSAKRASTTRSFSMRLAAGKYNFTVQAVNAVGKSAASARSKTVTAR
jgi:predicted phage tail protein